MHVCRWTWCCKGIIPLDFNRELASTIANIPAIPPHFSTGHLDEGAKAQFYAHTLCPDSTGQKPAKRSANAASLGIGHALEDFLHTRQRTCSVLMSQLVFVLSWPVVDPPKKGCWWTVLSESQSSVHSGCLPVGHV